MKTKVMVRVKLEVLQKLKYECLESEQGSRARQARSISLLESGRHGQDQGQT